VEKLFATSASNSTEFGIVPFGQKKGEMSSSPMMAGGYWWRAKDVKGITHCSRSPAQFP
jgi:hypothetical protein